MKCRWFTALIIIICILLLNKLSIAAYPTTTTHSKLYPCTSVQASPYSCDPTGVIDIAVAIEQIKANQSNAGTIYFPHGTYKLATNLTIPSGMTVEREAGSIISISTGITLTIGCSIIGPDSQFFVQSGTAAVVFQSTFKQEINAAWFSSLTNAVTSASTNQHKIRVPRGDWPVLADLTVPTTCALFIDKGADVQVATVVTLTINGAVDTSDGSYRIFSFTGTGTVALGPLASQKYFANWWGLTGDDSTNNATALQAALNAPTTKGRCIITSDRTSDEAIYRFGTTLTVTKEIELVQEKGTKLTYTGTSDGIQITGTTLENVWFIAPHLYCNNASSAGSGIQVQGANSVKIYDPIIDSFKYGIKIDGTNGTHYGVIRNPNIKCASAISGSTGVWGYSPDTTGNRANDWRIEDGTIWNAPADGYALDLTVGCNKWIVETDFESNSGVSIRIASYGNDISRSRFDNASGTYAYEFTLTSRSNRSAGNIQLNAGDRRFIDSGTGNVVEEHYIGDLSAAATYATGGGSIRTNENLIRNGHFQFQSSVPATGTTDTSKGYTPLNWTAIGTTGTVTYSLDTSVYKIGDRSLKIVNTNQASPRIYQDIQLPYLGVYTISGWVKCSASGVAQIRVGTSADNDAYGSYANTDTFDWQFVIIKFKATELAVRITCFYNSSAAGTAYWDGLSLYPGPVAHVWKAHLDDSRPAWTNNITDSHTGDTDETVLKTITIPKNLLNARGQIKVKAAGTTTANNGVKTIYVRINGLTGTALCTLSVAANANPYNWQAEGVIINATTASQRSSFKGVSCLTVGGATAFATGITDLLLTSAIDTTADVDLVVTGDLANGGDTVTCNLLFVEAYSGQ